MSFIVYQPQTQKKHQHHPLERKTSNLTNLENNVSADVTNPETDVIYRDGYSKLAVSKDSPDRFQLIQNRRADTDMTLETMKQLLQGEDMNAWRGIPFHKSTVERVIYPCLVDELQPGTIFETGSFMGRSAVWLADVAACHRRSPGTTKVIGVDLCLNNIHPNVKSYQEKNPDALSFLEGNSRNLAAALSPELLATCPKPWLIIEDCHFFFENQLAFFHSIMTKGDYLIVEDCNKRHIEFWESQNWPDQEEMKQQSSKPAILTEFLESHPEYNVDSYYQDAFGYNFAKSQNSILKKVDDK